MKKFILDECIAKRLKCKDGARVLAMHPGAFSRLKNRYQRYGECVLTPAKPGPKKFTPVNRTPSWIEDLVTDLGRTRSDLGPVPLADELERLYGVILDGTTVWRILKRKAIRYTSSYMRWKQDPKLYCLETPGLKLQMDACYPWGRSKQCAGFDAIDDCSRYIFGKVYDRETTDNAIDFVNHLIRAVPFRIQRIRVDNRYGKRFKAYCESIGIEVIANDPYSPEQNGKIERYHKTVKREFFWKYCSYTDSLEEIQYKYVQWQHFYNTQRRHRGYGMNGATPREKIAATLFQSLSFTYPQKLTLTLQQYII